MKHVKAAVITLATAIMIATLGIIAMRLGELRKSIEAVSTTQTEVIWAQINTQDLTNQTIRELALASAQLCSSNDQCYGLWESSADINTGEPLVTQVHSGPRETYKIVSAIERHDFGIQTVRQPRLIIYLISGFGGAILRVDEAGNISRGFYGVGGDLTWTSLYTDEDIASQIRKGAMRALLERRSH
jgi:hypothetical protein